MSGKPSRMVSYIVLDHAGGGELFDIIFMTGRFNDKTARHFFKQLADGVSHCHDHGIAHRDLKPDNIFMNNNYELKVADFGLSTMLEGRDGKGLLNTYVGTEPYMAPEILEGKAYDGRQVDIFACGIILFIMVSRTPPFSMAKCEKDDADQYYKHIYKNTSDKFWREHEKSGLKVDKYFSEDLKDLIISMLQYDPSHRPSFSEVLSHEWMQGEFPDE